MTWKRKGLIGILAVFAFGLWLFRAQTVKEIMFISEQNVAIASLSFWDKEHQRIECKDEASVEEVLETLEGMSARFDGLWLTQTIQYKDAQLYEIRFYGEGWEPVSECVYIVTDGRVYHRGQVYRIRKEDRTDGMKRLEELFQGAEQKEL